MSGEKVPPSSSTSLPPRKALDHDIIQVENQVAAGGQAAIYKARAPETELDEFVFREPLRKNTLSRSTISAFVERSRLWDLVDARQRDSPRWRDLKYNYITGIIDYGENTPWVALEHIGGGSLDELLEANPNGLSTDHVLWITECICRGLHIAHQSGVAHLDVKPSNILLRETPTNNWNIPTLTDWGLARRLAETKSEKQGFSPEFAAPEQFDQSKFGNPDTITDVYQVGCILYTLLTGSPPTTGSQSEIKQAVLSEEVAGVSSEDRSDVPAEVNSVVSKALQRDKSNRHRSIDQLLQQIQLLRDHLSSTDIGHQGKGYSSQSATSKTATTRDDSFRDWVEELRGEKESEGIGSDDRARSDTSDNVNSFKQRIKQIRETKPTGMGSDSIAGTSSGPSNEEKPFKKVVEEIRTRAGDDRTDSTDSPSSSESEKKAFKHHITSIRGTRESKKGSSAKTTSSMLDDVASFKERVEEIRARREPNKGSLEQETAGGAELAEKLTQTLFNESTNNQKNDKKQLSELNLNTIDNEKIWNIVTTASNTDTNVSVDEAILKWFCENRLDEPVEVIEHPRLFNERVSELESDVQLPAGTDVTHITHSFVRRYENQFGERHVRTQLSRFTALEFLKQEVPPNKS